MSLLSKSAEYAIRASIFIVARSQTGHKTGLKEVASAIGSPVFFTAKILQGLTRQKLISSIKGPNGGFYVDPDSRDITLLDLVQAVDGTDLFTECGLGMKQCSDANPCPIHDQYKPIREQITSMMERTTIQHLARRAVMDADGKSIRGLSLKKDYVLETVQQHFRMNGHN